MAKHRGEDAGLFEYVWSKITFQDSEAKVMSTRQEKQSHTTYITFSSSRAAVCNQEIKHLLKVKQTITW